MVIPEEQFEVDMTWVQLSSDMRRASLSNKALTPQMPFCHI